MSPSAPGQTQRGGSGCLPLAVSGLVYAPEGVTLIEIPSLEIGAGAPTVIMGPNGAGKSLLLRLLHGLIQPTGGEITWRGAPATPTLRHRQAMVFQRPVLLRRSVAANIDYVLRIRGLPRRERAERRRDVLAAGNMLAFADRGARGLSGGEQQRLAVLRALATEPDVLFMDEPTSSLDPAATLEIERLVSRAASGGTKIVFVTHDPGQARRLAGDILFLHHGRIAEHSPAPAFFDQPVSEPARAFLEGRLAL